MLKNVPFQDRMEARHTDVNNVQTWARDTFDTVVSDTVSDTHAHYAGFNVTPNGTTELAIAPGRLYRADGAVFEAASQSIRSITSLLPLATNRVVAVIGYGQLEDAATELRDFWVDLENDTTEPRTVVTEQRRAAITDLVAGQESATLPLPAIAEGLIVIAWVTLSPVGIQSIEMEEANLLPALRKNQDRLDGLDSWRDQIEPRVNNIASQVTALRNATDNQAAIPDFIALMQDVARVKERLEIPDDASDWGSDRFLTLDETDVSNIDLNVLVEEGVRFPDDAKDETQMALFNPLDANATLTADGLLLPRVRQHVRRLNSSGAAIVEGLAISQYGFQTHEMQQATIARSRIRFGPAYQVCNNNQWWRGGTYDSATNTFTKNGETFLVTQVSTFHDDLGNNWNPNSGHKYVRVQKFWYDEWEDPYWTAVVTDRTVSGAQVAQSFLNSEDGWLGSLNLMFTDKGPDGDVHVSICELNEAGTPNIDGLLAHVTIPHASIQVRPNATNVQIPPVFLEGGKRYAMLLTTLGSHRVAVVDGNSFSQGTFFYSTDGVYFQGDLTRDMWFELNFLEFQASRVEIELGALTLSGGIASIDILAGTIVPKSCSIVHQVLVGGAWRNISQLDTTVFQGLPPLARHRVVMQGTTAVAAGLQLSGSRVTVWRQRTTFKHISAERTLASTTDTVRVSFTLAHFDPARHTITCQLRRSDNSALVNASGFTDRYVDPDRIERTFSFTLSPVTDAFKIELSGTTNNALVPFHAEERVDVAL